MIIAISPIISYSYKYYPEATESLYYLGFIKISANGFVDASYALYYYLLKGMPLLLLTIWFVTSKQWWYHGILIPIAMYAFQLFTVLFGDSAKVDENEILYVLGVSMVVTPIVYFIRLKLVDKYVHGIDLKAMDTELRILKEKEELRKEREKLEKQKKELAKKM